MMHGLTPASQAVPGRTLSMVLAMVLAMLLLLASAGWHGLSQAQQLDARFSCSTERAEDRLQDGDRRIYADIGEFHLRGNTIDSFRWESSLFRSTHGFDCSIDEDDRLIAEVLPPQAAQEQRWRIRLQDGRLARLRRGYDADHGVSCSIRLTRDGDVLQIMPSCPALCGSRENFSALSVNLKTGQCNYEH